MEKEIEINTTAYRRRNLYMEKKMHIDGKNYEVVSVLPMCRCSRTLRMRKSARSL